MQNLTERTGVSTPMPAYISHKKAWALEIESVESNGTDTTTDENQIVTVHFVEKHFAPRRFNLLGKPTPSAGWYMVKYQDGYTSFSPKQAFEEGYSKEPVTFKDRVVAEKTELGEKAVKLSEFINGDKYIHITIEEQARLARQLRIMDDYLQVLDERIAAFS